MKVEKNKIIFAGVLAIIFLFLISYSVMLMEDEDNDEDTLQQTLVPELEDDQKEYDSKLDAINDLKEVRESTAPSIYDEKLLDSTGLYNPDLPEQQKQRIVDSIYKANRIQYSEKSDRRIPRKRIPKKQVVRIDSSEIQKEYPNHSVVSGGSSRKESAFNGLLACPTETEKVLIHDASRALVDDSIITRCFEALKYTQAVSTVVPTKDTVVELRENIIVNMPIRNNVFLEQTPQGFHYQTILKAHTAIQVDTTDDIRLVNEMGIKCATVEGSENNFKITTKQDYQLAKILLKESI